MTVPPRSTTRRILYLLQGLLLLATAAALVGPVVAANRVHGTAQSVRANISKCLQLLAAEEEDLLTAEKAVVSSFASGHSQLSGPGVEYQNNISRASRRLAQVAELNIAGDLASQHLRVLQGMLVTYQSLVSQAQAKDQGGSTRALGTAHLLYASNLLHSEILLQLHDLQDLQQQALSDTIKSRAVNPWTTLLWSVPAVVLLALLLVTQIVLARRFRRTLDLLLLTGTVLAVALTVQVAGSIRGAEQELTEAKVTLGTYTTQARLNATQLGLSGQGQMNTLVIKLCPTCTVTAVAAADESVTRETVDRSLQQLAQKADNHARSAESGLVWPLVLIPLLIALLVVAGLAARIEEYRYRSK